MVAHFPYFGDRLNFIFKRDYETRTFSNDQLAVANCGSYFGSNHATDIYTASQDGLSAPINTFGDFSPQYHTWYDSYSNAYDQEWWDNFNLNYEKGPIDF